MPCLKATFLLILLLCDFFPLVFGGYQTLPLYGWDKETLKTFVVVSRAWSYCEFESARIMEYHGGGSCPPFVGHTYVPDL